MSKEITALLLKSKLDKTYKDENSKKKYLIECLKKSGSISNDEIPIKEIPKEYTLDTCQICNSSNFTFTKHEKICNQCGLVKESDEGNFNRTYKVDLNFAKSTFIEPGSLVITVNKDGKNVTRDLSKLNTWLSSDPEEQRIKTSLTKILEVMEKIEPKYSPIVFERVKGEILSMWYNIMTVKSNIRGKEKNALAVWCIYYPMVYNKLDINIQKLAILFDIQVGDIYSYNFIMNEIFKDTPYEKYISIQNVSTDSINLTNENKQKINMVKRDLKDYLSNPIKDKEYYAIVYFVTKSNTENTLTKLSSISGLSTTIISIEVNKIKKFYEKNPSLKKRLNV